MTRAISTVYVASYRYDAAVDSKTAGSKVLRGPVIPSGSLITDGVLVVDTPLAGGTGNDNVSLGTGQSTTDLQPDAARNGAPWTTTGPKKLAVTGATVPVLLTADRAPTFTISSTALTGGKFRVILNVLEVV